MPEGLQRLEYGEPGNVLTLRRAWPRGADHLLLEYVDAAGEIAPGQWMRDEARLRRVAAATARAASEALVHVEVAAGGAVLIQRGGADRRLVGLAPLLARPGATLLSHRPERRAVVRLDGAEVRYAKVVRPDRLSGIVSVARRVREIAGEAFDVPRILEENPAEGLVIWSALPGDALFDRLLDEAWIVPAFRAAGVALRELHNGAPTNESTHGAAEEADLLSGRLDDVARLDRAGGEPLAAAAPGVVAALLRDPGPLVTVHRDFYDKQVVVGPGRRVGVLDFDTLANGEAALDVANALVHLELRTLQGRCEPRSAAQAAAALLVGYGDETLDELRLAAYADATRLRLACLYALRPRWRHLSTELAQRIGTAHPGRERARSVT